MKVLLNRYILFLVFINHFKTLDIPCEIINVNLYQHIPPDQNESNAKIRNLKNTEANIFRRNRAFVITILLGSPKQKLRFKLTSLFQGLWVIDQKADKYGYASTESATFQALSVEYSTTFGRGIIASDILNIPDLSLTIEAFPFYLLSRPDYQTSSYEGFIGIGYDQEFYHDNNDKKGTYNFFNEFSQLEGSYKRLIGFKTASDQEGVLSIGDYSDEIKANMKGMRFCQVTTQPGSHKWECQLNAVYFENNKVYAVTTSLDFKLGSNLIVVDEAFFEFLIANYFKEEIDNNKCITQSRDYIEVSCEKRAYDKKKMGNISFVFGKWSLKIRAETLFYDESDRDYFGIVSIKNTLAWFISPGMLLDYSVYFDRDNSKIGFYLNKSQLIPY